jgi:hypothetical protein
MRASSFARDIRRNAVIGALAAVALDQVEQDELVVEAGFTA